MGAGRVGRRGGVRLDRLVCVFGHTDRAVAELYLSVVFPFSLSTQISLSDQLTGVSSPPPCTTQSIYNESVFQFHRVKIR